MIPAALGADRVAEYYLEPPLKIIMGAHNTIHQDFANGRGPLLRNDRPSALYGLIKAGAFAFGHSWSSPPHRMFGISLPRPSRRCAFPSCSFGGCSRQARSPSLQSGAGGGLRPLRGKATGGGSAPSGRAAAGHSRTDRELGSLRRLTSLPPRRASRRMAPR